jgi:hypothetical protein
MSPKKSMTPKALSNATRTATVSKLFFGTLYQQTYSLPSMQEVVILSETRFGI